MRTELIVGSVLQSSREPGSSSWFEPERRLVGCSRQMPLNGTYDTSSSESVLSWQHLRASQENCEKMDTNAKEESHFVQIARSKGEMKLIRDIKDHRPNATRKRTYGSRRKEQISWSRYDFRLTQGKDRWELETRTGPDSMFRYIHIHHFDMFQRWCRRIRGHCPHHSMPHYDRSKGQCIPLIRPQ